jgi:hypothetical protein
VAVGSQDRPATAASTPISPHTTSPAARAAPAAPAVAAFLPATYRVTSTTAVDLDGSGTPQVVITAVGSVQDGGTSGFAPSTVLLLAWDPVAGRWTEAFDASKEPSYQASSQQGGGPGLVDLTGVGPRVAVVHDQPGGASDLVYWVDSVGGNSGDLIVGIVHFAHQIATLVFNENGDEGHVQSFDKPPTAQAGVTIVGASPHQKVQVTLPWLTVADNRSQAARMFSVTLAPTASYDGYQVVADDRPYVGVAVRQVIGTTELRVTAVDPASPAAAGLKVGDIITGVANSTLPPRVTSELLGPPVIDEVAVLAPGDKVALQVVRGAQRLLVPVVLAAWNTASPDITDGADAAI